MSDFKETQSYATDGVDVIEGDNFSSFAGKICKSSYNNSPFVKVHDVSEGHFRGPRSFSFENLPEGYLIDASPDGIGTKVVVIDAALSHRYAGQDLIAMTAGDITRYGGLPLVFVNVLDVSSLGKTGDKTNEMFRGMMEGLGKVAKEQNIVLIKGETAELGRCVGSENESALTKFNWAGMMIGVHHPEKMITGNSLAAGQVVIALRENGFRSNGMSSVRKAFSMKFGNEWWNSEEAKEPLREAAEPSCLYDRFLAALNGWFSDELTSAVSLHAVVHITGGGIPSKFGEDLLFTRGLSADLLDLWEPPAIMKKCAEWRGVGDREFYEIWNGGQGVLIVVDEGDVEKSIASATQFGIEAKVSGKIVQRDLSSLRVKSKLSGAEIEYKK